MPITNRNLQPVNHPGWLTILISLHVVAVGIQLSSCRAAQTSDDVPSGIALMDQSAGVPIVIAHRGASGYLPEHTTESAAVAHAMQSDYIEQDCVLTRDGVPVVLHDITLDDVTNVAAVYPDRKRSDSHWYVFDFTLDEVRRLRVTERRSPGRAWKGSETRFPQEFGTFRISTLSEHLQLIQGLNKSRSRVTGVYVEVKEPAKHRESGLDASTAILKVLTESGYDSADDPVFLQCFDQNEVRRIRHELKSPLPLIRLLDKAPSADEIKDASQNCDGLGVKLTLVVSGVDVNGEPVITELVRLAHACGLQVHVWTYRTDALPDFTNDPVQLLEWLTVDAGVDGIFTDQPDFAVQWRTQRGSQIIRANPFRLLNDRPSQDPEEQ